MEYELTGPIFSSHVVLVVWTVCKDEQRIFLWAFWTGGFHFRLEEGWCAIMRRIFPRPASVTTTYPDFFSINMRAPKKSALFRAMFAARGTNMTFGDSRDSRTSPQG